MMPNFERKIYQKLLDWKTNVAGEKALLIEGARRIGKTTIVKEFGKREYKSMLFIDFSDTTSIVKEAFYEHMNDLDVFFRALTLDSDVTLYPRNTLIVFDEVQFFPKARQAIKKLVEDGRYDYIETGSLISIKENVKDILIPSEERKIKMYPMDFEEFCWALGEKDIIDYIRTCFEKKIPLTEASHRKAMKIFKQFILVGGMPQCVARYIKDNQSFKNIDDEKRDIISLYRDDMNKIERVYSDKVINMYDQIPGFLSQHEKRVRLSTLKDGAKYENYEETFFWLSDSMIVNECFACRDPNVGLSLNENRSFVKCYMGDTGLLVSKILSDNEVTEEKLYNEILYDNLSFNEGAIYENAIAQMLVSNGHRLFFYTHYNEQAHRNDMEIDFIISHQNKPRARIYPIEVKSSTKYSLNSLSKFVDKFHERIGFAYVIHPKNLMKKDEILCIPPYMTICL